MNASTGDSEGATPDERASSDGDANTGVSITLPKTTARNLLEVARHCYDGDPDRPRVVAIERLVNNHVVRHPESFIYHGEGRVIHR